ncbi:MAG: arginine--tRNA ligase [Candidatus Saccharimonadales bacterium]
MKEVFEQALAKIVHRLYEVDMHLELTRPEAQFGDYATNVALQLAKQVGKNPREIGEKLAEQLRKDSRLARVEVAGPGFLNLTFTDEVLLAEVGQQPAQTRVGQTVLVEYSDPNPFKPLHAGHLYTTLVGDTIARLIERAGANTVRLNFGGDVGLHVGRCMWGIVQWLGGEKPEKLAEISPEHRPAWLGARYVEGNTAYENDEAAKQEIIATNKRVYALHEQNDHESAFAQIYWTCRDWSYEYFKTLYEQLDVVAFDRFIPESEVTPLGVREVRLMTEQGIFVESDGAIVYRGDESKGLHTRVFINSEGLPTYETKDVGLSLQKWHDYTFDTSIIITDFSQEQYMQVVLDALRQFAPKPADRTVHLTHGRVKLKGGIKISSRQGNGPSALDILEAARQAAHTSGVNTTEDNVLAAVKYAFAKVRVGSDIVYDPQESVALEGNSGPYLQYAHARARSILSKTDLSHQTPATSRDLQDGERLLVRKLTEYAEVIEKATAELMPHHICTYLYELAQEFNRFYEKNRVIGDDREGLRAELIGSYAETLKDGLSLLGIAAPERM